MGSEHGLSRGITSEALRDNPDFYQIRPEGQEVREYADKLGETVFGQERACLEVSRAMMRARAGFSDPNRPAFVGMFAGETGSGKTEMGRAIARTLSPDNPEAAIKIIDSSTFQGQHDVAKLVGSPPGYVGYGNPKGILITPDFLKQPNVIVFDEIEKGHPQLHKTLLSILDKGKLTVQLGTSTYNNVETVDMNFANSHIILTSNAGAEEVHKAKQGNHRVGFQGSGDENRRADIINVGRKAIEDRWRNMPEFLGRIDAIIVFDSLTPEVYERIFDKFLQEANENQRYGQNTLFVTDEVRNYIINKTDHKYGARDLRKEMEKHLITPAAEVKLLLPEGTPFVADLDTPEGQEPELVFWSSRVIEEQQRQLAFEKQGGVVFEKKKRRRTPPENTDPECETDEEGRGEGPDQNDGTSRARAAVVQSSGEKEGDKQPPKE